MSITTLTAHPSFEEARRLEDARQAFLAAQNELTRARHELLRLHSAQARVFDAH